VWNEHRTFQKKKKHPSLLLFSKNHITKATMRSRPTRRGSQKTEGINRETYHRIPPSLLSPTRTNLLLPRTLFADVVVKGETEASETREAEEREERKKERKKKQRAKGATAAAAALKTNRQKRRGGGGGSEEPAHRVDRQKLV
jgi:hypothetical protein